MDDSTDETSTSEPAPISNSVVDERAFVETGGTFSFFDAIFAVAMTLLVTTITPAADAWDSWSTLWDSVGSQVTAFTISFVLIAVYWWTNRRFLTSLRGITPRIVFVNLTMLAFVVLLPVTTDALGDPGSAARTSTIVYALNIAIISSIQIVLFLIARSEGVIDPAPSPRMTRLMVLDGSIVPVVFLLSIPVTLLTSPGIGRLTWISLFVLGPVVGGAVGRARRED